MSILSRLIDPHLPRIAGVIFISGFTGLYATYKYRQKTFEKEARAQFKALQFYPDSLKLLHGYPNLDKIFGDEVKEKDMAVFDPFNMKTEHYARICIPVEGTKSKGFLMSWASHHTEPESWRVDRLDIQKKDTQFTIYLHPERHKGGHPDAAKIP